MDRGGAGAQIDIGTGGNRRGLGHAHPRAAAGLRGGDATDIFRFILHRQKIVCSVECGVARNNDPAVWGRGAGHRRQIP